MRPGLEIYDKLQNKFQREVLDKIVKSDHVFGSYFGGENRKHTALRLCSCNKHYQESDYYYQGNLQFIHFTSQEKLKLILESEQLRLFNLSSQNDKEEFKFAARVLGNSDTYHEISRKRIYSLSMCELDVLNDLTMWRLYGENTKGIALKIEVTNEPSDWKEFHLSKVYYGEIEKIQNYKIEKEEFEQKNDFSFPLNLDRFMAFHKSKHFEIEKEVRLIHFSEPNRNVFSILPKPLKEEDFDPYTIIDLENNFEGNPNSLESIERKPRLKLIEIITGPNFENVELLNYIEHKIPKIPIIKSNLNNIYKA